MKLLKTLPLTILFSLSGQLFAESTHLSLLTENGAPLNMAFDGSETAQNDNVDGISTDLVREICLRSKVKCEISLEPSWKESFQTTLTTSGYGLYSTNRSAEREDLFKWVGPLIVEKFTAYVKEGSAIKINSAADLKNHKIGVYEGDIIAEWVESNGHKTIPAKTDVMNAQRLSSGEIDVWVTGELVGPYYAQEADIQNIKKVHTFSDKGTDGKLYLALNKSTDDAIVDKLQAAIDSMRSDGKYKEIISNYL